MAQGFAYAVFRMGWFNIKGYANVEVNVEKGMDLMKMAAQTGTGRPECAEGYSQAGKGHREHGLRGGGGDDGGTRRAR